MCDIIRSGVWVTKSLFLNFSVREFFYFVQVLVRLFESDSYWMGVTAAQHQSITWNYIDHDPWCLMVSLGHKELTHWGWVTHICVRNLTIIGSDNGLLPDRRQAIIWTNAGILLIGPLGTNFSEILIEILTFSFKKMRLKVSSAKRRPFCLLWPGKPSHTSILGNLRNWEEDTQPQEVTDRTSGRTLTHWPLGNKA